MTSQPKFFRNCSTHLHFSFPEQEHKNERVDDFPVKKAKRLFLAAQVFEKAIDDLMPNGYKNRRYAKSLQMPSHESSSYCLSDVAGIPKRLAGVVNCVLDYTEDPNGKCKESRYFKWNCFSFVPQLHYRTLEFRQMPPALSSRDVELWIHFAVGFIRAALAVDEASIDKAIDDAVEAGNDAPIYALYFDEGTLPADLVALKAFMGHKLPLEMTNFWDELTNIKEKIDTFFELGNVLEKMERVFGTRNWRERRPY
ncbi:hypothetical protein PG996_007356 [Apiospora saccharicola]|uniref:Uncharacterized protein n=1 Tax=Apiospora saccharicola TaxID=335842 RepID=A0ABR1VAK8_9PEZI